MAAHPLVSDALLDQAFEATTLGLALIDASGRTVRVNAAAAALLGREPDEVCAVGLQEVLGEGVADVDAVAVSLVADGEQRFAGQHGITGWAELGTPIDYSICQYPTVTGRPLVVSDAREHPLLAGNPAVDHVLGALCAIHPHPRVWRDADVDMLARFAELAAADCSAGASPVAARSC